MKSSTPIEIPASRYMTEYSEVWNQDVFCVENSQGEKFYLHTANVTIEGDEFSSLSFRRQIRRGAQAVLPKGYIVVESTNGVPMVQWDREVDGGLTIADFDIDF